MHHISASECVGWVMLQSLHTPWAPRRIFHDVSTGTTFTDGFTELGQDCVKVKLKQSQFRSCAPRLKSPRARLWQNTLLSETRHTRSIISYCEKQISISVSPTEKIISSRESLQPLRTGSCWWVPQRGPVKPETLGFREGVRPFPRCQRDQCEVNATNSALHRSDCTVCSQFQVLMSPIKRNLISCCALL